MLHLLIDAVDVATDKVVVLVDDIELAAINSKTINHSDA